MQILLPQLTRPWGLEYQMALLLRWLSSGDPDATLITTELNRTYFERLENHVRVESRPWNALDPGQPTLVGPYPATTWAYRASLENYCVVLPHLPWGLYPKQQKRWMGPLPVYEHRNASLIYGSLRYLLSSPWRWLKRSRHRRKDQTILREARHVLIYDDRIREPVQKIYERDPERLTPMATPGRAHSTDPGDAFVCSGPYEPAQNWHHVLDGYSLFVHRLGQTVQADWESSQPLEMWHPGSIRLILCGSGNGKRYLEHYVDVHNLTDRVRFQNWPDPGQRQEWLRSAVACVDLPLTGDASSLIYEAISMGVPGIYCRRHRELDAQLEDDPLAIRIEDPRDENEIGRALRKASQTPRSDRTPNQRLKQTIDPDTCVTETLKYVLHS